MSATGATSWHSDDALVDRYLAGSLDLGPSASLEAHLLTCEQCRARLTARVPSRVTARVEAAWSRVREGVQVPPRPATVRLLRRLGASEPTAVLLAAARSMSTAWTLATVVVLAFAALAVVADSGSGRAVYLIVAPLIPVAGVVAAFGSSSTALAEITATTPYPPARLVLLRAAGVAVTGVPLAVGVGLAVLWTAVAVAAAASLVVSCVERARRS